MLMAGSACLLLRCAGYDLSVSAPRQERPGMQWRSSFRRCLDFQRLESRALLASLPAGFSEAPAAAGLSDPTAMEFAPNGDLWVLEQAGLVKRFRAGSTTADVVADIGNLGL